MKKAILILIALLFGFTLGLTSAFYFDLYHTKLAAVFSKILLEESQPFKFARKFNNLIYFATDRNPQQLDQFSNKISYGVVRTNIPDTFRAGDVLLFSNLASPKPLTEEEFIKQLKLQANKPLIIWIHGYRVPFEINITSFAQIAHDLNIDGTFVTYDWTSNRSLADYQRDTQQIISSAKLFSQFIETIVQQVKPKKIIIIAHSLGTKLVALAFDELYQNPNFSDPDTEFSHVIFIAPNLDRDDFDQNFKQQITSMVKNLTIYVSSDDNALLLSKLFYNINSLGLPKYYTDNSQLDDIQALLYQQKFLPDKIDIVDVSHLQKRGFSQHSYFRERPVLEDMHLLISDENIPMNRYLLKQGINPKIKNSYWYIPP